MKYAEHAPYLARQACRTIQIGACGESSLMLSVWGVRLRLLVDEPSAVPTDETLDCTTGEDDARTMVSESRATS